MKANRAASTMKNRDTVQRVKDKYEDQLMAIPGVHAVAVGIGDRGRDDIVIKLYCASTVSQHDVPAELDGVRVEVETSGDFTSQSSGW